MDITTLIDVESRLSAMIHYETGIDFPISMMQEKNRWYVSCAIENPKKIAYFKDRTENGWNPDHRRGKAIMAKPGKFFKHCFPDLSDSIIQKMVSKWYAIVSQYSDDNWNFHISDSIKKWYHQNCYISSSGSLGSSCMKYNNCQDFLDFYDNYNVSILVLKNSDDMIKGRALLWKDVYFPSLDKTLTFMDRIYTCNDNDVERFKEYAKNKGYVYKLHQSMSAKDDFVYDGNGFYDTIEIIGDSSYYVEEELTPYLDTLTYATYDGDLSNQESNRYSFALESTDGRIAAQFVCDQCGDRIDEDEICSNDMGEIFCPSCYTEFYAQCEDCHEIHTREDMIYVEDVGLVCEDCLDKYYFKCYHCDEYVHIDYASETIDGDQICDYCKDHNFIKCDDCGLYEQERYITRCNNGDYCSNCIEHIEEKV